MGFGQGLEDQLADSWASSLSPPPGVSCPNGTPLPSLVPACLRFCLPTRTIDRRPLHLPTLDRWREFWVLQRIDHRSGSVHEPLLCRPLRTYSSSVELLGTLTPSLRTVSGRTLGSAVSRCSCGELTDCFDFCMTTGAPCGVRQRPS